MRAFISVDTPESVCDVISFDYSSIKKHARIATVKPENMHLTLHFLGEITEVQRYGVIEFMALQKYTPINITLDHIGTFERKGTPSIVYVGGVSPELERWQNNFKTSLKELGIKIDNRPFKSHLTLMRIKEMKNRNGFFQEIDLIKENFKPQTFQVNRPHLYKSTLTPAGAVYEKLY